MKNRYMTPVQSFAFGGIANPVQRAMLRGSDKGFLDARQRELDEFEAQRQAYNTALQDWQTNVYQPYQQQTTAYNTAAQQYNTDIYDPYRQQVDAYNTAARLYNEEVYNPYQTQFGEYQKAVEAYNAGDRLSDYSGPAAPTLAREFSMAAPGAPKPFEMQAPVTPEGFSMSAPVLPFKEEDVQKFQQEAAGRARTDAAGRAVAIDVVSDPDRFNFGSMSVANRFMAEGGPVEKTAREQLDDMSAPEDAAITRMLAEMQEKGGMDRDAVRAAVSSVAQAGRGGDELLAHLSPESREVLMRMGGSGTVNPLTGLPEFKGGFLGRVARAIRGSRTVAAPSPTPVSTFTPTPAIPTTPISVPVPPSTPAPAPAPGSSASDLAKLVAPPPLQGEPATPAPPGFVGPPAPVASAPAPVAPPPPPPPPPPPVPRDMIRAPGAIGSQIGAQTATGGPVGGVQLQAPPQLSAVGAATPLPQLNLSGNVGSSVSRAPGAVSTGPGSAPTGPGSAPTGPANSAMGSIPTSGPATPDYTSRGVGAIGDVGGIRIQGPAMPVFGNERLSGGAATSPSSYFAQTPQTSTGLAPGSAAIGPADMPVYGAMNTMGAIGSNPNLSPGMLGGQQNAGMFTDRLGNRIYSPGAATLYGYARGGEVDLEALARQNAENLSDEESEEVINTNPVGTAQQMLADLAGTERSSPTRMAVKRTKTSAGGGASADKSMRMSTELGDAKAAPESARAQMEELARVYQLRMAAARNKARGLSADTFGAPTLEGSTLTKGSLTKKRFAKGGEAKKSEAEVAEPSLFGVSDYATKASARMFPDQMGQDDQRDAARHMLAAGSIARKYGPKAAELLGKAHEYTSNPQTFFSMFGIGQPRDDLPYDVHNNRIGAELAARATSQADLERLVQAMALQAQTKQTKDKPYIMSREQMQARKEKAEKGMTERPEYRAKGSPEEGEVTDPEAALFAGRDDVPAKPGMTGKELAQQALYGVGDLPYVMAGAPVDLAAMAMAPFGYKDDKPFMGSADIKARMTRAGIRPADTTDPRLQGPRTASELLASLTNPAAVSRKVGPVVEKGVKAGAMEVGRQLDRAIMDNAGPLAKVVPQSAKPLYAVRPTGSTMLTGPVGLNKNVSEVDQLLQNGMSNARSVAGQNEGQQKLIEDFWGKKARNYFERQYGTPDDPIMEGIKKGTLKGEALSSDLRSGFTEHLIESMSLGKTRVKEGDRASPDFVGPGAPSTRFFPKHPRAVEEFTQRYDQATGLRGNLITMDPAAADTGYNMISSRGRAMGREAADAEADKLIGQGLRPELINTDIGVTTRSLKEPDRVINDNSTRSARDLYEAFEESSAYNKMTPEQQLEWANDQYGKGRSALRGLDPSEVGPNLLSENVLTAIEKGEPIYDIGYMGKTLQTLFKPDNINQYLASLPPRELANIRFEDAVRGGLKIGENQFRLQTMVDRIKAGKPVADKVFSDGVSGPLLQFGEGSGLDGFAWKRIEKRDATVPEGAYVGHSVGGYELGGVGYSRDKMDGFNTGKWRVYTLRDNRNRPVNTIEVKMLDENTPVVTQIKGNGRATGNTAPEKYDAAVLRFLQTHLKPAAIQESDSYLTPLLQNYKTELSAFPRV